MQLDQGNLLSSAALVGKYEVFGGFGDSLRDIFVASLAPSSVYTWEFREGVWIVVDLGTVPDEAFCTQHTCMVPPVLQLVEDDGVSLGAMRFIVAEYERVDYRMATIAFEETAGSTTLKPEWHFPLLDPERFEVLELATYAHQEVVWTGQWGSGDKRLHAFDFGCSSVDLVGVTGRFLRMAAGEYTLQTSGSDKDTYGTDVYDANGLRSDREGVHHMFASFLDPGDRGWRWQRQGE